MSIGFVHTECEMPKSERPRREACKHWEQGQVGERQVRGWRVIIAVVWMQKPVIRTQSLSP